MFKNDIIIKTNNKLKKTDKNSLINKAAVQLKVDKNDVLKLIGSNDVFKIKAYSKTLKYLFIYTDNERPLLFEYDDHLYPTIFAMETLCKSLKIFTVHDLVADKLMNGADLFIPGILVPEPKTETSYGCLNRDDVVAVNTLSNSYPFAIGVMCCSSREMFVKQRGQGVSILHHMKDLLFTDKNICKSEVPFNELKLCDSFENLNFGFASEIDEAELEGATEQNDNICTEENEPEIGQEVGDNKEESNSSNEEEVPESEPIDYDKLLEDCFLHAIRYSVKDKNLPMNFNELYASYLLKYCPENIELNIKKTSYKKFGKFMKLMTDSGIVKTSEYKGVFMLESIDREHVKLRFTRYLVFNENIDAASGGPAKYRFPEVKEVFFVTSKVLPIVKPYGYKICSVILPQDFRKAVTDYVADSNLNSSKKGIVNLDPHLAAIALKSSESYVELEWKSLFERLNKQMTPGTILDFGSDYVNLKNSRHLKIKLESMKRNNKMITRVIGNSVFRIDDTKLANLIQKSLSVSCSVIADKSGIMAVQAQGDQKKQIIKILKEEYGVPGSFIEIMDNKKK